MNRAKVFMTVLLLIGISFDVSLAQTTGQIKFTIEPESKLSFDGTSTLHSYSVDATEINGFLILDASMLKKPALVNGSGISEVRVSIPVKKMKSGKADLDNKMYETMNADKYPDITYKLTTAYFIHLPDTSKEWIQLQTIGKLTIAGTEKTIEMTVYGYLLPHDRIRFTGNKSLLMSEFGIKKPKMMLGLLRTGDEVVVNFDLVIAMDKNKYKIIKK